jgi:dynein light chain roadblock-type
MSSEVEETLKRIQSHRGVKGVLILNQEGIPIRSNLNQEDTDTYAALISQLNFKVISVIMMI